MATATTWQTGQLDLVFLNTDFTTWGDAGGLRGSAVAGSAYISLHTADPSASDQTSSECTYGSYARVAVARSGSGWSRSGSTTSNVASITFPTSSSGTNVVTYCGIGASATPTAGKLLFAGQLSVAKTVSSGDTPSFAIGALTVTIA